MKYLPGGRHFQLNSHRYLHEVAGPMMQPHDGSQAIFGFYIDTDLMLPTWVQCLQLLNYLVYYPTVF